MGAQSAVSPLLLILCLLPLRFHLLVHRQLGLLLLHALGELMKMGPVGVMACNTRPVLEQKNNSKENIVVLTTSGVAFRHATEMIAGSSALLLPDFRIYYLFEVAKSIYLLRSTSMRFELQRLGR